MEGNLEEKYVTLAAAAELNAVVEEDEGMRRALLLLASAYSELCARAAASATCAT
jgi:hypothetical protein